MIPFSKVKMTHVGCMESWLPSSLRLTYPLKYPKESSLRNHHFSWAKLAVTFREFFKFLKFRLLTSKGNWTLELLRTEAWSPLKEDLPHPSWAKTIFNE